MSLENEFYINVCVLNTTVKDANKKIQHTIISDIRSLEKKLENMLNESKYLFFYF